MFKLYGTDRLAEWRNFRLQLETSNNPLQEVAEFWGNAPFVNQYLNPDNTKGWPDAWHLVLDDKYDDLGVALGMLYTVKLTQRFMNTPCEIHTSTPLKETTPRFMLVVDGEWILNWEYKSVIRKETFPEVSNSRMLWQGKNLP